jgi:hypothetical protein
MQVLNFPSDNFDQQATFRFAYKGFKGRDCTGTGYLFYADDVQKIYVLQKSACLKAQYTAEDIAERDRLNNSTPIATGDVVEVDGKQYTVKINGNYSDAGFLIPM